MVNVRKRGNVYEYTFDVAKIEGKRKRVSKSGFKTKSQALKDRKVRKNFYASKHKNFSVRVNETIILLLTLLKYCYIDKIRFRLEKAKPFLYFMLLALEDTYQRLQQRLFKLTDEVGSNFHLAIESSKIANGLINQLEDAIIKYPNTKLVVIDTLQKVRKQNNDINYSADYSEISFINNNGKWQGSATELLNTLEEKDITPQYLTKILNEYSKTILSDNKICFSTSRTSSSRLVILEKDIEKASEEFVEDVIISNDNDINDDDDNKNMQ